LMRVSSVRSAVRRLAVVASVGVLALSSVGPTSAAARGLELVASGFSKPVLVANAGDGSGRLFVVEQTGRIKIIEGGVVRPQPFLDLSRSISRGSEQGLLGLAFHPSFESNGKFYVNYTNTAGDTAINEYRVTTDPSVADGSTGRRIMAIDQPYSNHNGGHIAFGPDGYLYIGMGDGGGAGDPGNRAQSLNSLLGKMLRIDINGRSGTRQYRIPSTNPYVGRTGHDQIWSRGLRNPWRWSFDRKRGDLWIADVGQSRYEEVNRSNAAAGRGRGVNYGWRVMEGRSCYRPRTGCNTSGKIQPLVVYGRASGCSVIGGYVYHGVLAPSLVGRYFFGDFCSGRIWTVLRSARTPATKSLFLDTALNITSFGEGEDGELYVTDAAGGVRRIVGP
jgi:glucose/arabinose dehydrogenase